MTGGSDEAGQEVPTTSPAPTPQPGTLTFTGRDGWETWDRAAVEAHAPAVAWASTIPFDPTDLAEDAPAIPIATIAELGGDEARDFDHIVVTALTVPSEYDPGVGSGRPTNLQHAAFRMPGPEEPPGDYAVLEIPAPRSWCGSTSPCRSMRRGSTGCRTTWLIARRLSSTPCRSRPGSPAR